MTRYIMLMAGVALLALTGCGPEQKDYKAMATCEGLGHQPGTKDYDQCLADEKTAELMKQQQQEFDQMKQDQQDWTLRRNQYQ